MLYPSSYRLTNGAITGVVKDTSGAVVPDVGLTLLNPKTEQTMQVAVRFEF